MGKGDVPAKNIMARQNSKPIRPDPKFSEDMKKIAKIRLDKGLAEFNPRALSFAEMTRLLRRTESYPKALEELKIKPKKENAKQWRI
ncbi:MAG: hypothetical protein KAQ92_09065 [Candidatus Aenigmarchaeota archaeon]|nr:hypothetical protein [Candidatus Aenigmarchaeota archaeon]MCK5451764.1 hypothetical protein [Candidatus Omnitrophota bacterium]